MPNQSWANAFRSFLDRRALIMLFLGFSAGIPILLIFSSLSLWLGEAGINKSAVTFFSWAALGYSFKFVWAPLVDEIPIPWLTAKLGRRRAWLLLAQLSIMGSILIMANADPAQGQHDLIQMAIGAVLLGFSAATQDIVIDAYRIELGNPQIQTVLASTYNAGYRLGMIVAGAGALFLASWLGTSKGNYIYNAWHMTYMAMAVVMLAGVVTTCIIHEPNVKRVARDYHGRDYLRLVMVFFFAVATFVLSYIVLSPAVNYLEQIWHVKDNFLLFLLETIRFLSAVAVALCVGTALVKWGAVKKQMALDIWVSPIQDFFVRYGVKLALFLLLLIGFYRISDIIAGVISNVFYQDLNFTKEEIAKAVKVYGVIFSLIGGFLGGLLAQRFNVMKLMFIGAILASTTNLMFIGLVKSGQTLDTVHVHMAGQTLTAQPDDVGYWKISIPTALLEQQKILKITTQYKNDASSQVTAQLPFLIKGQNNIALFPIAGNNVVSLPQGQDIVVRGQMSDSKIKNIELKLDTQSYMAKIDKDGIFSAVMPVNLLEKSPTRQITAIAYDSHNLPLNQQQLLYTTTTHTTALAIDLQPLAPVDLSVDHVIIQGKVLKTYSSTWLYFAIIIDNLASGLAGAAFIAFLSSLTSVSFTAVQYAIFSSLMTLTPKILGGYSGTIVSHVGYPQFFLMTTLMGIPVLILVWWVARLLKDHQTT
ncbi:MFS transporter, PAT family, beta-lactamase induction signal transducer AmpG [Acinetobacter boissieri]|uniref:MFS transporter, PAT family, beta-lactamase induction signal transducer AmpG n=2 Tax=Acinetobacter boissieri TaxID=1219383 RepID=A0A1G6GS45_9GAMM|nr:MFS transporter, PAT family, beta-lactamase induction signal transducer AmpG [Acinetobacter boissieri]